MAMLRSSVLTAFFSACGMSVWTFLVAMTLSLPKQLGFVYLGVGLDKDGASLLLSSPQDLHAVRGC